jgi:hypothetical protein
MSATSSSSHFRNRPGSSAAEEVNTCVDPRVRPAGREGVDTRAYRVPVKGLGPVGHLHLDRAAAAQDLFRRGLQGPLDVDGVVDVTVEVQMVHFNRKRRLPTRLRQDGERREIVFEGPLVEEVIPGQDVVDLERLFALEMEDHP